METAKQMLKFIKNLLLCGVALFLIGLSVCLIISYQYTNFSVTAHNDAISQYKQSENLKYIYTDGSEQATQAVKKISQFIQLLPSSLTEDFVNEWSVIIAKDATLDYSSSVAGLTVWQSRLIFLNGNEENEVIYNAFIHEFGHYFDISHGFCSKSPEFQKIYLKHKDTYNEQDLLVPSEYTSSTAQEFFASMFKEYYVYPEHLKTVAPEGHSFIETSLSNATLQNTWQQKIKNNLLGYYRSLNE